MGRGFSTCLLVVLLWGTAASHSIGQHAPLGLDGRFLAPYDPILSVDPALGDQRTVGLGEPLPSLADDFPDRSLRAELDQLRIELDDLKFQNIPEEQRPLRTVANDAETYPTLRWSGFLQVDGGWFIQDEVGQLSIGNIDDRLGLRRVRLRAMGYVRRRTSYVVDLDFAASGHPSFRDVMLQFHEFPLFQDVKFGYFQQPFSLDAMTSGQQLVFMERSLPFAFAPFRETGLGAHGTRCNDRLQWAVSMYRFPTDDFGRSIGGNGGYALAGRITALPVYSHGGRRLLHVGAGYSLGDPGNDLVRYQIQSGFFVTDTSGSADDSDSGVPVFVDTGDIPTDFYHLYNVELAANCGSLHLQSELTVSVVDQQDDPLVSFWGTYAHLGYYLTGEHRPYDFQRGAFTLPEPRREFEFGRPGSGIWEVVAGWSTIDLNDKNIQGGALSHYILALNWYPNALVRLQLNYVHAFLDDPTFGASSTKALGLRSQFKF